MSASERYGRRVLILGAGNCNDVDLKRLLDNEVQLHLADVDVDSISGGIERQGLSTDAIESIQSIEMTGLSTVIYDDLATEKSVESVINTDQIRRHYSSSFDVVISTCVFSQMAGALRRIVEPGWDYTSLQVALRRRYIDEMRSLTRSGGILIWISDLVSTDTCEELHTTPTESLPALLTICLNAGNFLSGTHPQSIFDELSGAMGSTPMMHRPWIWNMGARKYAVYAISAVSMDE